MGWLHTVRWQLGWMDKQSCSQCPPAHLSICFAHCWQQVVVLAALRLVICTAAQKLLDKRCTSVNNGMAGTRPSRLRSLTQAGDAMPNQMSTSNSETRSRYPGSPESATVMTHPHPQGLTVRTHVKSEHGSDGTGSGRTPGSVNIRVWKVLAAYCHLTNCCSIWTNASKAFSKDKNQMESSSNS